MSDPTFTTPPTPPSELDAPATYSERARQSVSHMATMAVENSALVSWVRGKVTEVLSLKSQSEAAQSAAKSAEEGAALLLSQSQTVRDDIVSFSDAPTWSAGTYSVGDKVTSPTTFRVYQSKLAGSSTVDPSVDSSRWARISLETLESIAVTKGIEMVSGYIDTSPNPPLSVQMANSLWNEPLNTATRGGRKELPAKRVWICTKAQVLMFDGDDPDLPLWKDFSTGLPSRGATKLGWIKACNGKVWAADVAGYQAIFHLDFTNDIWSWEGPGQGGGGTGRFAGRIYNPLLTNDDRVRDTAPSGTFYTQSFYPSFGNIGTRDTLCADIRVYPWSEVDPRSGLPIPTLAFGTINGLVFVNGPAGAGTAVFLKHELYTIVRSVCLRADGSVMYATDNGNSGRFIVVQPEIPSQDTTQGNPFGGDQVFFHSVPSASYGAQAGAIIDGAANIVMDGAVANNYGLTLLDLNHEDPSKSMMAFIKAYSNTGWMNKGTRMALAGTTVQGALSETNLCADPNATTTTGRDVSSADWKTAPNSDVNVTTAGKVHFDGSGTGYLRALSGGLIPKGIGAVIRWTQTGFSGTSDVGLRVHACNATGFNLHTVETDAAATGSYFPSADGTYEAYIPAGMIEQDYRFQFYKHSFDASFDIDNIEFFPVIGDLSQNLKYAKIRGAVQQVPVATGAELTALDFGGNNANYIEFEDASFLDIGAGDFSFSTWYKNGENYGSTQYLLFADLGDSYYIQCYRITSGGGIFFGIRGPSGNIGTVTTPFNIDGNSWLLINAVRKDGVLRLYINGRKVAEDLDATADVSGLVSNAFVGQRGDLDRPFWGNLAEWRWSDEALSDTEIAKMYRDEAPMFNPEAAASIAGGKSYVAAATKDRVEGTIIVGTDDSRSTFKGLTRITENMEKVGTAVVAHDGMVLED